METPSQIPKVSVVFITYNRPEFLLKAITGFKLNCKYPNLELIVSDDCSEPPIEEHLKDFPIDIFTKTEINQGLGANSNNGLRAATGEFILHNQDDFVCISNEPFIEKSIAIMEKHFEVGLVRLHHLTPFPNKTNHTLSDGTPYSILKFDQPIDMKNRIYIYSDHPHLKRANFHDKCGYFAEGLKVGETEDEFCNRFNSNQSYMVATLWRTDLFKNMGLTKSTRKLNKRTLFRNYLEKSVTGMKLLQLYSKMPQKLRKTLRRI